MKRLKKLLLLFLILLFIDNSSFAKSIYIVTINPAKYILSEMVGDKAEIIRLVPSGASPHTYLPKPSQVYKSKKSKALFFISNNLDAWVKTIPANNEIELIKLLPRKYKLWFNRKKNIIDPHFWTDPLAVRAMLPNLVKILSELNPENKQYYEERGKMFSQKLIKLNAKIFLMLKKFKGEHIFLFHPSFNYFLKRYGLIYSGAIEDVPGKEPSPKYIQKLVKKIKKVGANAIFTEPQLPERPAKIIAQATNLGIFFIDPLGNKNIKTYKDLILFNAKIFQNALKRK